MQYPFGDPLARPTLVDSQNPLTILLVEDSELDAHLFESAFRRCELADVSLLFASTLCEATAILVQKKEVDAVFLDLHLPDSQGIETLQSILPFVGSSPVIVISVASDQSLIRGALRTGAQDYLVKGNYDPIRLEQSLIFSIERRKVTAALRKTQENYEMLFQNNPLPAWLFQPHSLQILMVNEAAIHHYGYTRQEFLTMTIRELRPEEERPRLDRVVRGTSSHDYNSEGESWRHRKKDGTLIDVQILAKSVTLNGESLIYAVIHDVTEQTRVTSLLEENSRRLDLAINAGRMMILDVNYVKWELHVSSGREGILGYPIDFVSDIRNGLMFVHKDDREKVLAAFERGRSGMKQDLQFRIIDPSSNTAIWVERRSYLVYDNDGKPMESRGVMVDITALKQYEDELLESYKKLEMAAKQQSAILDSLPAHIALLDRDGAIMAVNDAWNAFGRENGMDLSEGWTGRSYFTSGHDDAETEAIHAGIRAVLKGERTKFEVEYPCHSPKEQRWFKASACTIDAAAPRGAVIMHIDITGRRKVEDELSQSRANLVSIFESTEDTYIFIDPQYKIIALNGRTRKVFPYFDVDDVIGNDIFQFLPSERRKAFRNALGIAYHERKATQYEAAYDIYSDTSARYYQVRITPALSDDVFLGYTICAHDITPHKRIQQVLADREQRFRALIENSGDMFTITDPDNRIVYASPNIEKILRYPIEEIVGKTFSELMHAEDRPYYLFILEQASRHKGEIIQKSSRMLTKDGEELWTEGTIIDLSDIPAVGGTVTNFRDITEKVHTQRELDHNRYILDKANEVTKIGYWVVDLKTAEPLLSWSPQLFNIFGVQESGFSSKLAFFDSLIHTDDQSGRVAALDDALKGPREYSLDYRIVRPDNHVIWVHEQAEIFFKGETPEFVVGVVHDITERKNNEQLIRDSKHNLDALINNTTDFLWSCDTDLRLISANTAFYGRLKFRYGVELNEGDRVDLFFTGNPKMEPWRIGYQTALSGTQTIFETESGTDGVNAYFQNILNPIWDDGVVVGVSGFSRNITESKKFENRIKAINERFEILSKATNDAVWDFDMLSSVITWNHGLRSIYGYEPDNRQTSFKWWTEMVHPDDLKFVQQSLQQSFSKGDHLWASSYRFRCANGSYRYSLDRGFIIYDDGKPVRMIGAQQDVHELTEYRMSLEQKVVERTIELQQALEKEKHLSEMKSRFVSIASHEFRTPLSTIQFATDFLVRYKQKLGQPDIDRKLSSISSQVRHMLFLLDDVLTVSKGEAGKIQVQRSTIKIRELVEELARNMENGPGCMHRIDVRFVLEDEIIYSDEKLLLNILTNLMSNAIKFSPVQKVIGLYCGQDSRRLTLEVGDNGIGINEQERGIIFEPFSRGKDVGAISGTGLGLSIVRTAVKLFEGSIELTQNETFRTVFRVELPMRDFHKI